LSQVDYDYIGTVETMAADAEKLRELFPGKFRNLFKILNSKPNSGVSAVGGDGGGVGKKLFSQLPQQLILKLFETFKSDFLIGGYPYPFDYLLMGSS
jgi:hypothetical protein